MGWVGYRLVIIKGEFICLGEIGMIVKGDKVSEPTCPRRRRGQVGRLMIIMGFGTPFFKPRLQTGRTKTAQVVPRTLR